MFHVVQDHQQLLGRQELAEPLIEWPSALVANTQACRDGGRHEGGVGEWRERNEEDAVREVIQQFGGHL